MPEDSNYPFRFLIMWRKFSTKIIRYCTIPSYSDDKWPLKAINSLVHIHFVSANPLVGRLILFCWCVSFFNFIYTENPKDPFIKLVHRKKLSNVCINVISLPFNLYALRVKCFYCPFLLHVKIITNFRS